MPPVWKCAHEHLAHPGPRVAIEHVPAEIDLARRRQKLPRAVEVLCVDVLVHGEDELAVLSLLIHRSPPSGLHRLSRIAPAPSIGHMPYACARPVFMAIIVAAARV